MTGRVEFEEQPVSLLVNVNVIDPLDIPVTIPELDTVAIAGLLLIHVPPAEGNNVVVDPSQMVEGPDMATTGLCRIIKGAV